MRNIKSIPFLLLILVVTSCNSATQTPAPTQSPTQSPTLEVISTTTPVIADVLTVKVTGEANAYQFEVELFSPDTGCDQYADWWEVLGEDGQLLYRHVLLHSHVGEQPFTRLGGPVAIDERTVVIVRAHMNTRGYGGRVLKGSVSGGFNAVELESGFAAEVESLDPLPAGCAF